MNPQRNLWLIMIGQASLSSWAFAQTVLISAQCNIYGSGHTTAPSTCAAPIGPGILPVEVSLPANAAFVEFHDVEGNVLYCPTCAPANGPDGASFGIALGPWAGISGISATHARFLEGVFLSNVEPTDPPPPTLTFNNLSFLQLSPGIGQQFFIGDGLTASGVTQRFNIPPGAMRLFLGFGDGYPDEPCIGAYGDNSGSMVATVVMGACSDCWVNCDCSPAIPILNANDFQCFLNAFAANNSYANCDGSTSPPILNANDFQCFLNAYAAGCS